MSGTQLANDSQLVDNALVGDDSEQSGCDGGGGDQGKSDDAEEGGRVLDGRRRKRGQRHRELVTRHFLLFSSPGSSDERVREEVKFKSPTKSS